jgi:hypothetical protein
VIQVKINVTYPHPPKVVLFHQKMISTFAYLFLLTAYVCPIINILVGGKAWSIIVLWSCYLVWSCFISPDLVEYNRISQFVKLISEVCILLVLIELLLAHGWAIKVLPIVFFSSLIFTGILFFSDLERQKQNMLPMLLFTFVSLICSIIGLAVWHSKDDWAFIVMAAVSFFLLVLCGFVLRSEFFREIHKRFHIK